MDSAPCPATYSRLECAAEKELRWAERRAAAAVLAVLQLVPNSEKRSCQQPHASCPWIEAVVRSCSMGPDAGWVAAQDWDESRRAARGQAVLQ